MSDGDWDLSPKPANSPSEWMVPVPAEYNSHLISLTKESGGSTFGLIKSKTSMVLGSLPEPGTNQSVHATFRIVTKDKKYLKNFMVRDVIGKAVMLEPFGHPGMVLMHYAENENLEVKAASDHSYSVFRFVDGLDKKKESVSLESSSHKSCYLYSEHNLGAVVKLKCRPKPSDSVFKEAASFRLVDGISKYDPISFVAKGSTRDFLMQPIHSIRDENYNVYFKI